MEDLSEQLLSAASWLATSFRIGWGAAQEEVRSARSLQEMPETRRVSAGGGPGAALAQDHA